MAALRDTAKITVHGRPMRIEEGEPLENSVATVHAVMKMQAERGGEPTVHNGVRGLKRHMNLTRIVQGLTMDHGENDRKVLARLISQVFRQTGAAVCLRQADPTNHKDPVWFVADQMPDSLIVVVNHVRGRSVGTSGRAPTTFDEKLFLRPGEKRLRPEEVGENQPAGEVTVTKRRTLNLTDEDRAQKSEQAKRVFGAHHAEQREIRAKLREDVHEFIVTAPVPMTHPELVQLFNAEHDADWNASTLRGVVNELEQAGRIGSRKETAAERLIRGGGGKVKATAPKIYGPPEGVPERTELPRGIKPLKTSVQWGEEKRALKQSLDTRVYRAMDVPNVPGAGHGAPRTVHMIAVAADVSDREAQESLDRMIADGRVWQHPTVGYYTPMTRVRRSTLEKYRDGAPADVTAGIDELVAAEVTPAVKAAEARPARDDDPVPTEDIAAMIRVEVQRALAATSPATVPTREVLLQELIEVRGERDALATENAQLLVAISHLEAALTALRR